MHSVQFSIWDRWKGISLLPYFGFTGTVSEQILEKENRKFRNKRANNQKYCLILVLGKYIPGQFGERQLMTVRKTHTTLCQTFSIF